MADREHQMSLYVFTYLRIYYFFPPFIFLSRLKKIKTFIKICRCFEAGQFDVLHFILIITSILSYCSFFTIFSSFWWKYPFVPSANKISVKFLEANRRSSWSSFTIQPTVHETILLLFWPENLYLCVLSSEISILPQYQLQISSRLYNRIDPNKNETMEKSTIAIIVSLFN